MSERLDRIEAALEATRKITESNARAIEASANESAQYRRDWEERDRQLQASLDKLTNTVDRLANIVLVVVNRQDDREDRINRLEQQ
jgi:esterase/lipase